LNFATFNWGEFSKFVHGKYAKSNAPKVMSYSKRYFYLLETGDIGKINSFPPTVKTDVIKCLIIVTKYMGLHEQFKTALKSYGIKVCRPDAFAAFIRLYNNHNSNLDEWFAKITPVLTQQENLLLRFLRLTGLRANEGITSFNKIIELSKQGKLSDYLNSELGILEHFRYKEDFLRGTKNAFISIVPESIIGEISNSQPVTYAGIIKKLQRRKIPSRISELRDYYGTFMIRHGLVAQEADLLCGRIPPSIFVRHYFSPAIKELKERTLKALGEMTAKGLQ
jgi:hypothetical protein